MQTYTCIDGTIRLLKDPICGKPPTAAELGSTTLPVKNTTSEMTVFGPIPESMADGVYPLSVTTPCGCFEAKVYLHRCMPPRFPANHKPTNPHSDTIAPECKPPK